MSRRDQSLRAAALALAVCAAPLAASAAPPGCPPGLAKKTPPCVPPGLAQRQSLRVGEVLPPQAAHRLDRPWRYGLPRDGHFVVLEGLVLRLDPDTRAILTILGAAAELLD